MDMLARPDSNANLLPGQARRVEHQTTKSNNGFPHTSFPESKEELGLNGHFLHVSKTLLRSSSFHAIIYP